MEDKALLLTENTGPQVCTTNYQFTNIGLVSQTSGMNTKEGNWSS